MAEKKYQLTIVAQKPRTRKQFKDEYDESIIDDGLNSKGYFFDGLKISQNNCPTLTVNFYNKFEFEEEIKPTISSAFENMGQVKVEEQKNS